MAATESSEAADGEFLLPISSETVRAERPYIQPWNRPNRAATIRNTKATIIIRDNTNTGGGSYTQNFFLQSYHRGSNEQMQMVLHTEGWNLIFHQSQPTMYIFNGTLYDEDGSLNWSDQFIDLYESRLKGTVASRRFFVSVLFAGRLVSGYVFKLDLSSRLPFDTVSSFALQMIATTDSAVASPSLLPGFNPIDPNPTIAEDTSQNDNVPSVLVV